MKLFHTIIEFENIPTNGECAAGYEQMGTMQRFVEALGKCSGRTKAYCKWNPYFMSVVYKIDAKKVDEFERRLYEKDSNISDIHTSPASWFCLLDIRRRQRAGYIQSQKSQKDYK